MEREQASYELRRNILLRRLDIIARGKIEWAIETHIAERRRNLRRKKLSRQAHHQGFSGNTNLHRHHNQGKHRTKNHKATAIIAAFTVFLLAWAASQTAPALVTFLTVIATLNTLFYARWVRHKALRFHLE